MLSKMEYYGLSALLSIFYIRAKNLFTHSPQLNLITCVFTTDSNTLKPSIEFDSRLKACAGLYISFDIGFIKKPKITSFTTLDNAISFPCSTDYVPKAVKTGEIENGKILSQIRTFQMCSCCLQIKFNNHIIEYSDACSSRCELCVLNLY